MKEASQKDADLHASINLTAVTYEKWLPLGNKSTGGRLGATIISECGSKVVAATILGSESNSEVRKEFGGPCRGRTYGPMIKRSISHIYNLLSNDLQLFAVSTGREIDALS
jgi:hypothetical protein